MTGCRERDRKSKAQHFLTTSSLLKKEKQKKKKSGKTENEDKGRQRAFTYIVH